MAAFLSLCILPGMRTFSPLLLKTSLCMDHQNYDSTLEIHGYFVYQLTIIFSERIVPIVTG